MTQFPSTVYRCPGPHFGPFGTTYESRGVADEAELAARLAEGWHATLPAAADAFLNPQEPVVEVVASPAVEPVPVEPAPIIPADDEPPTRAELEQKARELGIRFDGRTTDRRLLKLITEKLGG